MDELEVFFCDLCGTSVPASDLGQAKAMRLHGKIVGLCCLQEIRTPQATGGGTRTGMLAGVLILVVAVAGATVFIDSRLSEAEMRDSQRIDAVTASLESQSLRLGRVQARLMATASHEDWETLEVRSKAIADSIANLGGRLASSTELSGTRMQDLMAEFGAVRRSIGLQSARLRDLQEQFARMSREVEQLRGAPSASVPASFGDDSTGLASAPAKPVDLLPAGISRLLPMLQDPDAGTRFEGVDGLLQSEDSRIFAYIIPLAADPDPFVRRLVVEGLASHKAEMAIETLLHALDDPESLVRYAAVASLKKLTDQSLPFDAEAPAAKRASMRKRWQDWWQKNKLDFF